MPKRRQRRDYQPVRRSQERLARKDEHSIVADWPIRATAEKIDDLPTTQPILSKTASIGLKRGHVFSYLALFLFTLILYARPAEFYPSPMTASIALIVGVMTLILFLPTQLSLEGNLTARPREVNLVLLFCLTGLLSILLAIDRAQAWHEFSDTFIRCIAIFVVIVNVVRTETRLKGLMFLALATGVWLSLGAINDYRLGLMTVEGYRAGGRGGGIFGNSNDMALFLVTLVPIAIAFAVQSRSIARKFVFGGCAVLMVIGIVLTYSRGGFIGLLAALGFLAWRIGRQRRVEILLGGAVVVIILLTLAPGYALRLASIVAPGLDPVGSSEARQGELLRSLYVAIRHPLLGIGMGNYAPEMSYRGLVTHNSYTQVAAEMGASALVCYTLFLVSPFKRLGQIARETFGAKANSHFYYLAVGLQASLVGYLVCSFFASVAYLWYVYYLVAYAVCLRRIYESEMGRAVVLEKRGRRAREASLSSVIESGAAAI